MKLHKIILIHVFILQAHTPNEVRPEHGNIHLQFEFNRNEQRLGFLLDQFLNVFLIVVLKFERLQHDDELKQFGIKKMNIKCLCNV